VIHALPCLALHTCHHCLGLRYKQFLKNQLFWSQMASQHVSLSMLSLLIMFEPFFDRLKGLDQMA